MYKRIKDLNNLDKPIEKAIRYGFSNLSDEEVIAILIRTGTKEKSAIDLSRDILQKWSIENIDNASLSEMQKIKGIKLKKAVNIFASIELSKRVFKGKNNLNIVLDHRDVYKKFKFLENLKVEEIHVLFLNVRNQVVGEKFFTNEDPTLSKINIREIAKMVFWYESSHIYIIHNHPSGDPEPSQSDFVNTTKLHNFFSTLNVGLIDHIIVGKEKYYSFKMKKIYNSK